MGNNHIEAENASSQDFIKERIKERPVNKAKLMRKMAASTKGKISQEDLSQLCYEDIWLEPEEALEMGLIDEIIKERI